MLEGNVLGFVFGLVVFYEVFVEVVDLFFVFGVVGEVVDGDDGVFVD